MNEKECEEYLNLLIKENAAKLDKKEHIKKYYKLKDLHNRIETGMQFYFFNRGYDYDKYMDIVCRGLSKKIGNVSFNYNLKDIKDVNILLELFIYDNDPRVDPIIDIYLKNRRSKNPEKIKMLEAMKNSYVGLFEIIDVDKDEGYAIYQDIYTKKIFKVVDVALSSTLKPNNKRKIYIYNRIITYDGLSFGTGINCIFSSESKKLMRFIKSNLYLQNSSFINCMILYEIYRNDNSIFVTFNKI